MVVLAAVVNRTMARGIAGRLDGDVAAVNSLEFKVGYNILSQKTERCSLHVTRSWQDVLRKLYLSEQWQTNGQRQNEFSHT